MKLREFINTSGRSTRPLISINLKSGVFYINRISVDKMGIDNGFLQFFNDEENPKDWYIKASDITGCKLRTYTGSPHARLLNNASLKNELVKNLGLNSEFKTFIIGSPTELDGEKYFPMLFNKPR